MIGSDGKLSKLTLKQRRFADEYIITGNAYQSALKAGYSDKYAKADSSKLLENTGIKSYIDERLKILESEKIATQEEVLAYLTSVMRGERTEQTLCSIGELGQQVIDIDVGAKDRIKAAELIGKRYGIWTDKQEITQKNIEIVVGDWDADED
ncbi:terminase small subunit [Streptococcus suis]|uniref:terminase small subunit n=1 Tax=Streptococcus suis TaxID=1307 RepID=UPI001FC9D124